MSEKTEPICANCKHYSNGMDTSFGRCRLSRFSYPDMPPNAKMYSGCGLNTKPDFGCNQFQAKEETE